MADRIVRQWDFKKEDHTFHAKFYSSDIIEVTSPDFLGKKATQAGTSGPELIAKILAGELISEERKG